jgi:aminomethyltransferase
MSLSNPRKTALNAIHRQLGGRMVEFAGWEMPVQYAGPIPEHLAVRTKAGIFDVSHMGEIELIGSTAEETIQKVTPNDVRRLAAGQIHYSALTTPEGTFVDDILVYRLGPAHFFLCVNASNQQKDFEWIRDHALPGTEVLYRSDDYCQFAIQGPKAIEILRPLTRIDLAAMKYYWFGQGKFAEVPAIVSRTGYTGEDGYEVYVAPADAEMVWTRIMDSGEKHGLAPVGLAARNTLRLEAKMALYGHDIDDTTTVLEADLGWICKFDKGEFIGRQALAKQREEGLRRVLVGFEMVERGIARDQYPVWLEGKCVGAVTSGSPAPFLQKNIGLTYLPFESRSAGTEIDVIIRDKAVKARVVPTPFYKRSKAA